MAKSVRVVLTMQRIAAATCPPDKSTLLLWDAEQPGLAVRIYPTGRKVFVAFYRTDGGRKGGQRWLRIGEVGAFSLKDARAAARMALGAVAKGADPAGEREESKRRERALVRTALDRYEADLDRRQIVKRAEVMSLLRRELEGKVGNVDLALLDRATLVDRINEIEASGRRGAARDFRSKASVFLNWAAQTGLITASPLAGWRKQRRSRAERLERPGRALGDHEIPVFWRAADRAADPYLGAYLKILLLTGQRRTETGRMRWSDLDLVQSVWTIPAEVTKSGRAHKVPLPPEAISILKRLPIMGGSDLVFPGRGGKQLSGWTQRTRPIQAATTTGGLARWTLHDLRRTVRTGLGRLGIEPQIAELLLNHAVSDELTAVYDRGDYWQRRADAAGRWARHVANLAQGKSEKVVEIAPTRRRRGG